MCKVFVSGDKKFAFIKYDNVNKLIVENDNSLPMFLLDLQLKHPSENFEVEKISCVKFNSMLKKLKYNPINEKINQYKQKYGLK